MLILNIQDREKALIRASVERRQRQRLTRILLAEDEVKLGKAIDELKEQDRFRKTCRTNPWVYHPEIAGLVLTQKEV